MNRPYLIVSGYHPFHGSDWFFDLWFRQLHKFAKPSRVFIIADVSARIDGAKGEWITLGGDLGHCNALLRRERQNTIPGCPATWMLGCWLAYIDGSDLIVAEQDMLPFGPWIEGMYSTLGHRSFITGAGKMHGLDTSLLLVRHEFIPTFVEAYLHEGPEDHPLRICEFKVQRLEQRYAEEFCRFPWTHGADRPFNVKDRVFTPQKLTRDELLELEKAGLIDCAGMPKDVNLFSNNP